MRAIEALGKIDKDGRIELDQPLDLESQKVKVIILLLENEEIDDSSWLKVIKGSEAFDFLQDEAEDIYSIADGKPVDNEA